MLLITVQARILPATANARHYGSEEPPEPSRDAADASALNASYVLRAPTLSEQRFVKQKVYRLTGAKTLLELIETL